MENTFQDRRTFLKDLGMISGVSLAAGYPWLSAFSQSDISAGSKARIGIIGPGSRGRLLMNYLVQDPHCEIVAICDNYQPSIDEALKITPGVKVFKDYRELLAMKDIDGVVIAVPLHEHAHITLDAFSAGKHVFCEKTLAKTPEECLSVYKAYKESGKVLFVGQQRLYDPRYIKAIDMVRAGLFGDIQGFRTYWFRNNDWRRPATPELERKINWRLYNEYSCGLMTELASHQIQIGNWVMQDVPRTIMGTGSITHWKDGREVFDNVSVLYEYQNGVKLSFQSIIANKFYGLEEEIMGTLGTIEPEKGKYYFETLPPAPGILQMIHQMEKNIFDSVSFAGPSWVPEVAVEDKGNWLINKKLTGDGTDLLLMGFVAAVIEGKPVPRIAEEGYYAAILALLGHQSMMEKRIISFPEEYLIDYYA
jgi:predicted dehydrogenase